MTVPKSSSFRKAGILTGTKQTLLVLGVTWESRDSPGSRQQYESDLSEECNLFWNMVPFQPWSLTNQQNLF